MKVSLFEAARPYLERRWPVFPVARNKIPLTEHGRNDATLSGELVREWSDKFTNANIAIATGKESGLAVIDIDGPEGLENFQKLRKHYEFDLGPISRSANGWHIYYRNPGGRCPTSQGRLGRHIDVRGAGGSITAPPSIHETGHEYHWVEPLGITMPQLPLKLYPLLYEPKVVITRNINNRCEDIRELVEEVAASVPGERNGTLNRAAFIAGRMVSEGRLSHDAAYQALYQAAKACGLKHGEIKSTLRSGLKAGAT